MLTWIANIVFISFFTFINYLFLSIFRSGIYRSLVVTLGILLAVQVTITDLYPIVLEWQNKGSGIIQRAKGEEVMGLPIQGKITQGFNPPHHHGIDIAAEKSTPIYAQSNGLVLLAEYQEVYGNVIVVRYQNGYEGVYAHLSEMKVRYGNSVTRWTGNITLLGYTGNTGKSSGNHLHYEVRLNGVPQDPLNI